MSKSPRPKTEQPPTGLEERLTKLAKALRLSWSDGGGMYRSTHEGRDVWRLHSDWAGTGAVIDVDASSLEVVLVQEEPFERVGKPLPMRPELRPAEAEARAFLAEQCALAGIPWPSQAQGQWDEEEYTWCFKVAESAFEAVARGRSGALRLVRIRCARSV